MQKGGFKSYTNRESEEEMDKDDQFLKPRSEAPGAAEEGGGGDEGGGEAESPEAEGEEAAEKATYSQLRARPSREIKVLLSSLIHHCSDRAQAPCVVTVRHSVFLGFRISFKPSFSAAMWRRAVNAGILRRREQR